VNRNSWFGGDEWFILTDRGITAGPGHKGLFQPHYEHWTTVPILAYRALYSLVGLHLHACPTSRFVIVAHLATVVLLWYVMVRSRIDAWVAVLRRRLRRARHRLREPRERLAGDARRHSRSAWPRSS
jgi:hypothetical protein